MQKNRNLGTLIIITAICHINIGEVIHFRRLVTFTQKNGFVRLLLNTLLGNNILQHFRDRCLQDIFF